MVAVRDDVDVNKLLPGLSHLWCAAEGVDRVKAADVCSSGDTTTNYLVLPSSTPLLCNRIVGSSSRRSSMASAKVLIAGDVVVGSAAGFPALFCEFFYEPLPLGRGCCCSCAWHSEELERAVADAGLRLCVRTLR